MEYEFFVAGVKHHQLAEVIEELDEGQHLVLVPEPSNRFDPNAIKIEYEGTLLGYVPKKFSAQVSAMLTTSGFVECIITNLDPKARPWEMCKVVIRPDFETHLDTDEEMDDL